MHIIQEKLLELAQRYDLKKMSLRQVGRLIGIEHPQKVKFHMGKLGLLEKGSKKRSVKVKSPLLDNQKSKRLLSIPILGLANCGDATMIAEARIEGMLPVSSKLISSNNLNNLFAVKAVGLSMNRSDVNGKTIEDGDYVIVDGEDKNPKSGDYVLSVIGGMANIKRFVIDKKNSQVVLQSDSNKFFPPIHIHEDELDDYLVNGKVIEVIKQPQEDRYRYESI